jgi:cell division septum initiation protein DivIVA
VDLSHQSITGHQFELNRRGYDPDTVDRHLAEIAAAVADRANRLSELEGVVGSLQAKVQDADESQEALRLTLKAAAHAKEELLANAREQAKTMEDEAAARAESLVADAEAKAAEVTSTAEAQAKNLEEGARAQAGEVAKAALVESEGLVARIEDLRERLVIAESALGALKTEADPHLEAARVALESAVSKARESAQDPALLAAFVPAVEPAQAVAFPDQPAVEAHHEAAGEHQTDLPEEFQPEELGQPESDLPSQEVHEQHEPDAGEASGEPAEEHVAPELQPVVEAMDDTAADELTESVDPDQREPEATEALADNTVAEVGSDAADTEETSEETQVEHADDNGGPHLEVVDSEESAADISDKVDRLLEELREVT